MTFGYRSPENSTTVHVSVTVRNQGPLATPILSVDCVGDARCPPWSLRVGFPSLSVSVNDLLRRDLMNWELRVQLPVSLGDEVHHDNRDGPLLCSAVP